MRGEQLIVSRAELEARHELAEDLALHLADRYAQIAEYDVAGQRAALRSTLGGLLTEPAQVSAGEAAWVVARLTELREWKL